MDLCASRHLWNNPRLFTNTPAKKINFIIIVSQVIWIEKIYTIFILLEDGITIEKHNIALAPGCNLNLILLGQLQESSITYSNDPSLMTLLKGGRTITCSKKSHNLFTFDLTMLSQIMSTISKAMAIISWGQPTYFVNKNKHIRLWH